MNIMLFSRIVAHSGVGSHMKQLAEELEARGNNVIVVSSTNDLDIGGNNSKVRFIKLDNFSMNPVKILKNMKRLREIIEENDIKLVHCHHRKALLYIRFYNLLYRRRRVPVVYTLHLADVSSDFIHRIFTAPCDQAIGVSSEVSRFLVDGLGMPADRVNTVLNGVDTEQLGELSEGERRALFEKWEIPEGRIILAMHSRIEEVKNHLLAVEAMHELAPEIRNRFFVVCSGLKEGEYYERVVEKISEYGMEDCFRFVGWTETRDILGVADALVVPSVNEGFLLSAVEAFFLNVLVIRTRTAGFEDQKYCIPIDMYKTDDLVAVLTSLAENGFDEYKERIEEANRFAWRTFTLSKMTDGTIAIYKKALDGDYGAQG